MEYLYSRNLMKDKIFTTIFSLALIFIVAISSLNLQVIEGARLKNNSVSKVKTDYITASRGLIFDRQGRPLVQNKSTYSLYLKPSNVSDVNDLRNILKEANFSDIEFAIGKYNSNIHADKTLLDNNFTNSVFITKYLSNPDKYKQIEISESYQRIYLQKGLLTHVVGYTGEVTEDDKKLGYRSNTEIGKDGLELSYDKQLRGSDGKVSIDTQTNVTTVETPPINGENLNLSIDLDIQSKLTEILQSGIDQYQADGAVGLLENVETGEILASVSLPTFDSNLFVGGIGQKDYAKLNNDPHTPQLDRVTNSSYPPGSMFKINTATSVLETQSINKETTFFTGGTFQYGGVTFRDFSNINDGTINIIGGLCKSSNIFFMKSSLAMDSHTNGHAIDNINDYGHRYGLALKTGIDIPEGYPGNISSPSLKKDEFNSAWQEGDLLNAAIGQGLTQLSPIQIMGMTTAVANGGNVLQPHIVKSINDSSDNTKNTPISTIVRNNINVQPQTLDIIHQGMFCGVHQGIIQDLNSKFVDVAAKSGTAEFGAPDASGAYPNRHAWVTGFFPFNKPKYAFTLLLEKGGTSARTVILARKFVDWLYSDFKIDEKIKN